MGERLYYEPEKSDAETEINRLLETADHRAHQIILEQKENTHRLAQALLSKETLTRQEVLDLLNPADQPCGELVAA
jgi:ATP-dependent Zn protease